jgi:hypothetical protein
MQGYGGGKNNFNNNLIEFMKGELDDLGDSASLFISNQTGLSAFLFIPGLGDGLFPLPFMENICSRLASVNFTFAQIIMRSSYGRYGQYLLEDDCKDIEKAVAHLKKTGFNDIFLMGHSTGCQDVLYFLKHSSLDTSIIKRIILLGSVSDRESPICPANLDYYLSKEDPLFIVTGFTTLFKKERLISLFARGGAEDMFSSDLDRFLYFEDLKVKTLILLGNGDDCVPEHVVKEDLLNRWKQSNPSLITGHLLEGKHMLDEENFIKFYWPVIANFICNPS